MADLKRAPPSERVITVDRSPSSLFSIPRPSFDVKREMSERSLGVTSGGSGGGETIIEGYLSKQNRQGRWDKRWFFISSSDLKLKYHHNKPSSWRVSE
jgi:hypothetical protein